MQYTYRNSIEDALVRREAVLHAGGCPTNTLQKGADHKMHHQQSAVIFNTPRFLSQWSSEGTARGSGLHRWEVKLKYTICKSRCEHLNEGAASLVSDIRGISASPNPAKDVNRSLVVEAYCIDVCSDELFHRVVMWWQRNYVKDLGWYVNHLKNISICRPSGIWTTMHALPSFAQWIR